MVFLDHRLGYRGHVRWLLFNTSMVLQRLKNGMIVS